MRPDDSNQLADNFPKPPKKKLEDLPEATKKRIIIVVVSIFSIIMLSFWLNSFLKILDKSLSSGASKINSVINNEEWRDFQLELDYLLEEGKTDISQIIKQAEQLTSTTTPQNLSAEDLKELKNKLLELKSNQR